MQSVEPRTYNRVWAFLIGLTALEVLLAYEQLRPGVMLSALLGLSVVKAVLIIAYFMHLKFERLSLTYALFPALIAMILALLGLFPDAARMLELRPS
ncbi:MAG: cytochrome C oxidase subunit IV family protein [Bryobacteraceae bacterium]